MVLVVDGPAVGVKPPRVRSAEAAMQWLTAEQVRATRGSAGPGFRPFVAVCVFAGLRLGEAAGLQSRDVAVLRRTISVSRQVQGATAGTTTIEAPKYGSERIVYAPTPSAKDKTRAAAKSFMSAVLDPPADSLRTSEA